MNSAHQGPRTEAARKLRAMRTATFEVEPRSYAGARDAYLQQLIAFRVEVSAAVDAVSCLSYRAAELRPHSELAAQLRKLAAAMEAEIGDLKGDALWHREMRAMLDAPVLERGLWRLALPARPAPKD